MKFYRELLIEELPREAIKDCSASGDVSAAVKYWVNKLDFTITDRALAIQGLQSYGCWDYKKLKDMINEELSIKIFWLACCNFSEFITYAERAGFDPFSIEAQSYDTPAGSSSTLSHYPIFSV